MSPEIAKAALEFLKRVQLTGAEVAAFNAVVQALIEAAQQPEEVTDGVE